MNRFTRQLLLMVLLLLVSTPVSVHASNSQPSDPQNTNAEQASETPAASRGQDQSLASVIPIAAALASAIVSALCTWLITRSSLSTELTLLKRELSKATQETTAAQQKMSGLATQLKSAQKDVSVLTQKAKKLEEVKSKLKLSAIVRTYRQPVILVGPREAGKTSLLMQWHSPWITSRLDHTQTHKTSDVPIYDFEEQDLEPHFAYPEILVPRHTHLVLRVHDFPGELPAQKSICATIVSETEALQQETGKNLGIVLICMFDAVEAHVGLSRPTQEYYNGELFRELRSLVIHGKAQIDRLILVFNKYDKLKAARPDLEDRDLLELCLKKFDPTYASLHNVCNKEKVCEVFTMLCRDEMALKNRGAPIVLGEAARAFVRALAGKDAVRKVVEGSATNWAAEKYW